MLQTVDGTYVVSGIIDWEDAGFYPSYYESTMATVKLPVARDNDWFLYLQECISPTSYPVQWLVDRFWELHLYTV